MSEPDPIARLRRRLARTLAIVAACVVIAALAIVGYLSFHIPWMGPLFAAAMIAGFGAQIWLIVSFAKK